VNITELWSRLTPDSLNAASFAGGGVVLGDASGLLLSLRANGTVESELPFPPPIRDVSASRDGRVVALLCGDGELVFLSEGRILWRKLLPGKPSMIRVGVEGDHVLALSRQGHGLFFNRFGRQMAEVDLPGGADSFALVPTNSRVVAATRDGLIQCFTSWGKPLWSTELNLSTGRIRCSDSGDLILIPTMAFGVEAMTVAGESVGAYEVGEPIKAACPSGDGRHILVATLKDRLVVLDRDATVLSSSKFSSSISDLELSGDGRRALVTTECGYAHLIAINDQEASPLLEMDESSEGCSNPRPLFSMRVFSPFSLLMQARATFANDSASLVIAGDRQRVQVLDLEGNEIARRNFGGSLLRLAATPDGAIRVFASKSVFTFTTRTHGTRMEWGEAVDIQRVTVTGPDTAVVLTDDAEVVRFRDPGDPPEKLFYLESPDVADFTAAGPGVAAVMNNSEVLVYRMSGEVAGRSGPWPMRPRFLAAGMAGYLVGIEKLILLLDHDGVEQWRQHLPAAARTGHVLPATFLVKDEAGTVHAVTFGGSVHQAFSAGAARVEPFPDGGEGPGFILIDGGLLTAADPDGRPRWRYRMKDDVTCMAASPDGRLLAVMAGIDLHVLPLVKPTTVPAVNVERTSFLEFADG
jgi:hypothetical protein